MGRRENASPEQARAETELAWQRALEGPTVSGYRKSRRDELLTQRVSLAPGDKAGGRLGMQRHAAPLLILMLLSVVVLLIGCANLANLLLARASARTSEIGTRLAIGASRGRLIRQLLVESLLLSTIGGALGLAFGFWAHRVLVLFMIGDAVPTGVEFTLDRRLLLFTMGVSLATALLFGLAPALRGGGVELVQVLKRAAPLPGSRAGKILVVAQVAACVVLLAAGALLARTLANLRALDRGFSADNLLLMNVGAGDNARTGAHVAAFYQDLISRAEAVPGVVSASLGANVVRPGGWKKDVWVQGRPAEERQTAAFNAVAPGFFATAGMPFVFGRDFSVHDRFGTARVAIVNEAFARAYCPQGIPIGCRFKDGRPDSSGKYEVVGVVRDARHGSLRKPPEPMIYEALMQEDRLSSVTLHARAHGNPALAGSALCEEVRQLDATLPVFGVRTIAQQIDRSLRQDRMMATLSGFFALLALFLTCIGLFGTVAYGVERAHARNRNSDCAWRAARPCASSRPGRHPETRWPWRRCRRSRWCSRRARLIESMLFGISPSDPSTVAGVVLLLLGIASLACYLPARRATGLDPMVVLRRE
jgi:predicted permease